MQEAEKHLTAIQQRNPFIYREAEAYEIDVAEKAKKAELQIDFTKEIDTARKMVKEVIEKMNARETEKACAELLPLLDKVVETCKESNPEGIRELLKELAAIRTLMENPMTELAAGRHVPMSDKSYYELVSKLLHGVSRLGVDHFQVNRHNVVTLEELNVYFGKQIGIIRRYIQDPKEWAEFINDLREIGDPKTKTI